MPYSFKRWGRKTLSLFLTEEVSLGSSLPRTEVLFIVFYLQQLLNTLTKFIFFFPCTLSPLRTILFFCRWRFLANNYRLSYPCLAVPLADLYSPMSYIATSTWWSIVSGTTKSCFIILIAVTEIELVWEISDILCYHSIERDHLLHIAMAILIQGNNYTQTIHALDANYVNYCRKRLGT